METKMRTTHFFKVDMMRTEHMTVSLGVVVEKFGNTHGTRDLSLTYDRSQSAEECYRKPTELTFSCIWPVN